MSVALRSLLPSRRRSLFALGALTFGLGLTARWHTLAPLSARPLFLRPFSAFTVNAPVMSGHAAPQPPPRWNHAPDEVRQLTKDAIQRDREERDRIAALPKGDRNFSSVLLALAQAEAALSTTVEPLAFYQNVSPDKALRDASNEAEALAQAYDVESSMRADVFAAVQDAAAAAAAETLGAEDRRLVEKMVLDGKRNGLALPADAREKLTALRTELSGVQLAFSKNMNEEDGHVALSAAELVGVPPDVVAGYPKRTTLDGTEVYDVPFKTTDIFPVLKQAVDPAAREKASTAYEGRLAVNTPLLARAIALRREIAGLLGYATWADYQTEPKMVKTGKGVADFLDDLQTRLEPVADRELATLKALKAEERAARGLAPEDTFYLWDYRYYDRLHVERSLALDDNAVKEHFPVARVVPAILGIYQDLLSVRFEEVPREHAPVWHEDVQAFAVWEKDAKAGEGFVGWCYLDLFPRPNKYSHAAVFTLNLGFAGAPEGAAADGGRHYPVAAMVANLAKPTPGVPALLRHDDVVTFFHEMGHVFHALLSRTRFLRFHGTSVARDFVEAPSQMLENWCWEPRVLRAMSSHYKTGAPLSDELIERLVKSRYVNVGLFYLRQLFFAKFDLLVHSTLADPAQTDYTELWNSLRTEVSRVHTRVPTPGQGSFGHLVGGYDAGYYGYTYSLVFAADMYRTVFAADPLDPARGRRYRDAILLPGGSRDEMASLEDFLGRPPNSEAFLEAMFGGEEAKK